MLPFSLKYPIAYIHKKCDIDILISNAGIMEGGPIAEQPLDLIRSKNVGITISVVVNPTQLLRKQ
jgi:short-subunit dehydrogenase